MSGEWKPEPGTFGEVQRNGANWHPAIYTDGHKWICLHGLDCKPNEARPVLVIDPEGSDVNSLIARLGTAYRGSCHDMRTALRSLLSPPKPEEPTGLGAVVEDAKGRLWTNTHRIRAWYCADEGAIGERPSRYADIDAVKVLSEGVS